MDLNKIVDKLHEGVVLLEYTSLISGNKKIREMTLCNSFIPKRQQVATTKWSQDQNSKLICYDLEFMKWDDIDKDTILSWKVVEREKDFKKIQKELTELNHDGNED